MSFHICVIVYNQFFFTTIIQMPNCFLFSINLSRLEIFLNQADNFLDVVLLMSIIAVLISKTDSRPVSSRVCLIRSPLMKKNHCQLGKFAFIWQTGQVGNPMGIFSSYHQAPQGGSCNGFIFFSSNIWIVCKMWIQWQTFLQELLPPYLLPSLRQRDEDHNQIKEFLSKIMDKSQCLLLIQVHLSRCLVLYEIICYENLHLRFPNLAPFILPNQWVRS